MAPGDGEAGSEDCGACPVGELCVGGECVPPPGSCPCPSGAYCDPATQTCVVGCQSDDDCGDGQTCDGGSCRASCTGDADCEPGRVCNDASSTCVEGCRDETDCPDDARCVDGYCAVACSGSDECEVPGTECIGNVCVCPSDSVICDGECRTLDTNSNCGACGLACEPGQECVDQTCFCPPGKCEPIQLWEGDPDSFYATMLQDRDALYLQHFEELLRIDKDTGVETLVVEINLPQGIAVNDELILFGTTDGGTFPVEIHRMPKSGGSSWQIGSGTGQGPSLLTASSRYAFWRLSDQIVSYDFETSSQRVLQDDIGLSSALVASPDGESGYWVRGHTLYRADPDAEFSDPLWAVADLGVDVGSLAADETHVYFTSSEDQALYKIRLYDQEITRLNEDSTSKASITPDGDQLYMRYGDPYPRQVVRISKDGGSLETVVDSGANVYAVDERWVHVLSGTKILKYAK